MRYSIASFNTDTFKFKSSANGILPKYLQYDCETALEKYPPDAMIGMVCI